MVKENIVNQLIATLPKEVVKAIVDNWWVTRLLTTYIKFKSLPNNPLTLLLGPLGLDRDGAEIACTQLAFNL